MSDEVINTTTVEDTAAAAPVSEITPEPVTPATSAPATGSGSEQPASSSVPATAETTQARQPGQPAPPPIQANQPPVNWEKRYSDLQSLTDRRLNQAHRDVQQHGQELAELRSFRQQQEDRARQLQLKPWSKQHPDYQKFQGALQRAKTIDQQLGQIPTNLPPEQQEVLKNAILSAVSPEDRQQLQQYREENLNFQRGFFEDPRSTLAPILTSLIQEQIQQATAQAQASYQVEKDFESSELKPLVQSHAAEIQEALANGVPYDYAIHMVKMFGELQTLKTQMSSLNKDAVMGKEQQRLAKGNASFTRDPAPAQTADPYELAKKEARKLGISTDDPRFFKLLEKFDKPSSKPIFTKE